MKATKQIDIYLIRKRNVRTIDIVQYDTGVQLVFTVKDFTIPSGATAALYVQKPSGKFVLQEDGISVAGNIITVNLENQAITEHGKVPYQVSLKDGSDEITTFTGLMMVEKSLKNAGAMESKTVIRAFDEAVSERVTEFRDIAERIVRACIATIPDDYSTMEAKVNALANAVKGYLSGAVVVADDVSPVEHNMTVWVHGKNLLKPEIKEDVVGSSVNQVWQCTGTVADDGKITLTNTATSGVAYARVATLTLKKGKTYRFLQSNSSMCVAWYKDTTITAYDLSNAIKPSKDTEIDIALYMSDISKVGNTESAYLQMEYGATATDYEAYIDPSTVTVTRYGADETDNPQTYTPATDGTVSGITSLSPNMTILTDTEGVIVECEYNRDTNKVIDKLINAITALGGTV